MSSYLTSYLTVVSAFGRLCGHTTQGRLHKSLKATRVATLLYVNFLFVVFDFPLASRLVFILRIYIWRPRTCEKNCHILIGCLFVNLRLTHEPCLGITIECFHMTSRRPCWCPKTKKWRPCWCPKRNLWELNSIFMQILSFVSVNQYGR